MQIKNKNEKNSSSSSMSTFNGDTKEEEDVKNTDWYRVCTRSQGGHERGNQC